MSTSSSSPLSSEGIPCPSCGLALEFGSSSGTLQHVDGSDLCVVPEPGQVLYVPGHGDPATGGNLPVPVRAPAPAEDWHYDDRRVGFPWGLLGLFIFLAAGAALGIYYGVRAMFP